MNTQVARSRDELLAIAKRFYADNGPREGRGRLMPPRRFAALTPDEVDQQWDFASRHEMHRVAQAIVNAGPTDSERLDVAQGLLLGADFEWGEPATPVVVLRMPEGTKIGNDLREFLDAVTAQAEGRSA